MATTSIVDAHHHLWDLKNYYPWLTDRPNPRIDVRPFARDYSVREYLADAAPVTVSRSVHVQAGWDPSDPVAETEWLSAVAANTGYPHAIIAAANLASDNAAEILRAHAAYPLVRGLRMLLTWHTDPTLRRAARPDYLADDAWLSGLATMNDLGLSFDLQLYPEQMPDAAAVASRFSDMRFIVDHLGLPVDATDEGRAAWKAGLLLLAQRPNVAIKLSGFSHFLKQWTRAAARPFIEFALETFGPERCLFGSNFPVDRPLVAFSTLVEDIDAILAEHDASLAERVFSANAIEWYRLDG